MPTTDRQLAAYRITKVDQSILNTIVKRHMVVQSVHSEKSMQQLTVLLYVLGAVTAASADRRPFLPGHAHFPSELVSCARDVADRFFPGINFVLISTNETRANWSAASGQLEARDALGAAARLLSEGSKMAPAGPKMAAAPVRLLGPGRGARFHYATQRARAIFLPFPDAAASDDEIVIDRKVEVAFASISQNYFDFDYLDPSDPFIPNNFLWLLRSFFSEKVFKNI
ncbi:Protein of unknown function [Gryllus bimaculatus]|nr:Protein of unknown function [Gryllus bimaculatus]